jgi:DNA-binding NarL/FixJ family response regulator
MSIRVVLADDHKIMRDGLKSMLVRQMDIEVVGEAETGREALDKARELSPDVVVMDIGMRELNGIDATKIMTRDLPNVRVVALSMHSDRRYVSEMLAAGAAAYLLKDSAFDELTVAIRAVASGRTYLSAGITGVVVEDYLRRRSGSEGSAAPAAARGLSAREREVLQLIAEGLSTKEIAAKLHLSVKTVETHRRQMMDKLGIFNIAGLIKFAVREGLASLED